MILHVTEKQISSPLTNGFMLWKAQQSQEHFIETFFYKVFIVPIVFSHSSPE